jgi:citrate lyase subunit beta/citryl-CoA lyase
MRPYRTLLFIPGNQQRMLRKGAVSDADALLPDLEDSVPIGEKAAARAVVHGFIRQRVGRPVFVRINAAGSPEARLDLEAVVVSGLAGIVLPKTESSDQVRQVAAWIDELEPTAGVRPGQVVIIPLLESALGVLRGYEIATASPRVASLCCASGENGDLQADLGCDWSLEGIELLYARSKVVLDARAAGLDYPLDGVYVDLTSVDGLVADTRLSKRLGFKGRMVIHPAQIAPVNAIYAPGPEEVDYYRRLLEAFEAAVAEGRAAAVFEGKMIDYATAGRARRVLAQADLSNRPWQAPNSL